ncbi:MAG TPA: hypothetical protein VHV82_02590 [Sporichthyaceae bacterium]|jgi:hypothetical protein|nr:hypothetical protein [Sporichthyaceae bacterium]
MSLNNKRNHQPSAKRSRAEFRIDQFALQQWRDEIQETEADRLAALLASKFTVRRTGKGKAGGRP